jgi:hypothetical protein
MLGRSVSKHGLDVDYLQLNLEAVGMSLSRRILEQVALKI